MRRFVIALAFAAALAAGVVAVAVALTDGDDEVAAAPSSVVSRSTGSATSAATSPEILPDLDQAVPENVSLAVVGGRERITFLSAVDNAGAGSLVVDARRSPLQERMAAQQIVAREDGTAVRYPLVNDVEYVRSETHEHWHLLDFDRYELRDLDGSLVAPDRKTGFCLGDRYDSKTAEPPEQALDPLFTGECGRGRPELLRVREGISPGYGDDYVPLLEGQYLDVTGLAAGRYVLVHRVNADGDIRESDYENNAASVLLRLVRPAGAPPEADVVQSCPDASTCR